MKEHTEIHSRNEEDALELAALKEVAQEPGERVELEEYILFRERKSLTHL